MYNISVGHTNLGEYIEKMGLKIGDMIARGQLNTIKIIAHRDYILQDTNVNLPIPKATAEKTLEQSLTECIKSVQTAHGNAKKYQQFYYPAASYCNAYAPTLDNNTETLAEPFTEGHWFLMSSGEMARCSWYAMKGYNLGIANNIFAQAKADFRFEAFFNSWYQLSSEISELSAWVLKPVLGLFDGGGSIALKFNAGKVRPAVAFKL